MRITYLSIKDYLGIKFFQTDKLGKLNLITGKNGIGKSTIVKAIQAGLGSVSGVMPKMIRSGEDEAEIIIKLDNDMTVRRRLTGTANQVKVTTGDAVMSKPNTFLAGLIGPCTFNPVELYNAKPGERRQMILSAMKVVLTADDVEESLSDIPDYAIKFTDYDFSKHGLVVLEEIQKDVYEERSRVNRDVSRLQAVLETAKRDLPAVDPQYEGFDYDVAMKNHKAAMQLVRDNEELKAEIRRKQTEHAANSGLMGQIKAQIVELKGRLDYISNQQVALDAEVIDLQNKVDEFQPPDIEGMEATLKGYQGYIKASSARDGLKAKEGELEGAKKQQAALDAAYKVLKNELPRSIMAKAQMPVDGLEVEGDDILINGVSIDTLSTSEKIRLAVRIARFLSSEAKLKVILVDGFEALDPEARQAFIEESEGDDFEYFVTQVTDGELKMESISGGTDGE